MIETGSIKQNIPFVDLKAQYTKIKDEINQAIQQVIRQSDFILGEEVEKFEKEFAEFCGVRYAAGVDTGVSALELGMLSLGIGPGDEVITPTNSFIASSSAVSFTGAKPVLVDCDEETYGIDIGDAENKITKKTKAIMPVHLYGQMVNMDKVKALAKRHNLYVVEDACQAHGASYRGRKAGSFGDFAAFSFYPGKNLGAYGDGGIVVTNNKSIYEKVRMMRNYGQKGKYNHIFLARNRRLDTLQAAILRVKLKYLDTWNDLRRKYASLYTKLIADCDLNVPNELPDRKHIFHLYVIRHKRRDQLKEFLEKEGISVGIHYPIPIHLQVAYKDFGHKVGDFPRSEQYAKEVLSLPMFPELTEKQIRFVAEKIRYFTKN